MATEDAEYEGTASDVLESMELLGIKESNLNNVSQALYLRPGEQIPTGESIILLELDKHILERIEEGDSLFFQGDKTDTAVLCTRSRTYDIEEAETSNSLLLVSNLKFFRDSSNSGSEKVIEKHYVEDITYTYFTVEECTPKWEKLFTILDPSSYKGPEYESSIVPESLYDWKRLRSEIQASEEELKQGLKDYLVTDIDGYLRLVSFECEARTIAHMLDVFEENSWELEEVNKEATYESVKELVNKPVFESLFEKYTKPSYKKDDGTLLYSYDEGKCCNILAKVLLAACSVVEYDQFMELWRIGTPDKMEPKEEYLGGTAFIRLNTSTMKKEVVALHEKDLSRDINERLNKLFEAKDKWTIAEITPYVLLAYEEPIYCNPSQHEFHSCFFLQKSDNKQYECKRSLNKVYPMFNGGWNKVLQFEGRELIGK